MSFMKCSFSIFYEKQWGNFTRINGRETARMLRLPFRLNLSYPCLVQQSTKKEGVSFTHALPEFTYVTAAFSAWIPVLIVPT